MHNKIFIKTKTLFRFKQFNQLIYISNKNQNKNKDNIHKSMSINK